MKGFLGNQREIDDRAPNTAELFQGVSLGSTYALIALGLTLQYGVARIMNLAYGEFFVAAALGAFWLYTGMAVSPLVALVVVMPLAFAVNWGIYMVLLVPLVRRARNQGMLEVDSILATFGLLTAIALTCGFGQIAFNWAIFMRAVR